MTNNDIFKKLRVALQLRDDDIVEILKLVDYNISKTELSAFFRREDHPNYKNCGDQVLRNFLNGLVIYMRGSRDGSVPAAAKPAAPKKTPVAKPAQKNKPKPFPKKNSYPKK